MNNLIDTIRDVIGVPVFYSDTLMDWNYGSMLEYVFCGVLLVIVVTFSFKALIRLIDRI